MLDSFRRNAFNRYSFIYPDAIILMNRYRHTFMILRQEDGLLLHGEFADRECPFLHYVPDDAGPLARRTAAADYWQQVKQAKGVLRADSKHVPKHETYRSSLCEEDENDRFLKYGFALWGNGQEIDQHYGCALFLDGHRIAKSTFLHPQPAKYFSHAMYRWLMPRPIETSTGWSSLVMVLGEFSFGMGSSRSRYEIKFPNTEDFFGPKFDAQSKDAILKLRDFLCSMESIFSAKNIGDDAKADFVTDEGATMLDSAGDPTD